MSTDNGPRHYEVLIGDAALEDLRLMRTYLSEQLAAPEAARRTVAGILDSIESLAMVPLRNRIAGTTANGLAIRRARWGKYAILCLVDNEAVRVAAVVYGARDLGKVISGIVI